MSNKDMTLAMRLYADTTRFVGGLVNGSRGVDSFVDRSKRKLHELRQAFGSLQGGLATLGVSVGAGALAVQSAHLDKDLMRISQTAAMGSQETIRLRNELFRMAKETGASVDELKTGFDNAVQAGLNIKEALPVTDAVNKAMAVTGASADKLTSALTVASTAYQFDLTQPGMAITLLDKMTKAGRQGNAELGNLADIFARVAVNGRSAGFGFDQTLSFIEGLSQMEKQPERLATLADSTMRLFTNANYMKEAAKGTGVRFFDSTGGRRDPMAVLADLRKQYSQLKSEKEQLKFMDKAFGKADLDTQRGMKMLFTGKMLEDIQRFSRETKNAGGTLKHDLSDAINNSIDQTGRLKAALREAADGFAQPINDTFSNMIGFAMDSKEKGGLGMSGTDIAVGGATIAGGAWAAAKLAGMIFGKGKKGGLPTDGLIDVANLGKGVAVGKALSQIGVQPVYVVNMPGGGMTDSLPGIPGSSTAGGLLKGGKRFSKFLTGAGLLGSADLAAIPGMGAGAMATAGLMVAGAGAAGYGAGTLLYDNLLSGTGFADKLGESIAKALAMVSSDRARESINKPVTGKLDLNIKVDSEGRATVSPSGPVMLEPPTRTNPAATGRMLWGG
ncbi:MAG TPA: phage tail tape measure protein [Fluviicoccus sp.]|nr:phage tail tape measure protein [Fluviicoccus sp.]